MKKFAAYGLIGLLLSVTVVASNWHNHPITGEETPDCPAYIISIVLNSDVPVCAIDTISLNFINSVIYIAPEPGRNYSIEQRVLGNKSPPII